MSEQAQPKADKQPEVHAKTAPKRNGKAKEAPKPSAANVKLLEQLDEIGKELARIESLQNDRTQLIGKLTAAKVPTAMIAKAAHLSVARTRQIQAKTK
jgi:cellobiose phosphorylase